MLRRDTELAFAGGAWVFPGGRIDPEDYPGGVRTPTIPKRSCRAAHNAAAREAKEEAGLTVDPATASCGSRTGRRATGSGRSGGSRPGSSPRARPSGDVLIDDGEIRDHQWIRPAEALRRDDAGEILIIPPTWITLNTLAGRRPRSTTSLARMASGEPEIYVTHIGPRRRGHGLDVGTATPATTTATPTKPGPRQPPAHERRRLALRTHSTVGPGARGTIVPGFRLRREVALAFGLCCDSTDLRWVRRLVVAATVLGLVAVGCSGGDGYAGVVHDHHVAGHVELGEHDRAHRRDRPAEEDRHDPRHAGGQRSVQPLLATRIRQVQPRGRRRPHRVSTCRTAARTTSR